MSELHRHLEDYLRLRRSLGFKLEFPGLVLPSLVTYLEAAGAAAITAELAVAWAGLPRGVLPITWAHRLGAARGFARYLKTIDPATEIPPGRDLALGQPPPPAVDLGRDRHPPPAFRRTRAASAAARGDL